MSFFAAALERGEYTYNYRFNLQGKGKYHSAPPLETTRSYFCIRIYRIRQTTKILKH
jgi:hypothetical protein